jgi:hypothetical protein
MVRVAALGRVDFIEIAEEVRAALVAGLRKCRRVLGRGTVASSTDVSVTRKGVELHDKPASVCCRTHINDKKKCFGPTISVHLSLRRRRRVRYGSRVQVHKLEIATPGSRTSKSETDGVNNYTPEAWPSAEILTCSFGGNVAHMLRGKKIKSGF